VCFPEKGGTEWAEKTPAEVYWGKEVAKKAV